MNRHHHTEQNQRHRQPTELPVHSCNRVSRHRGQDQHQNNGDRRDQHAIHKIVQDMPIRQCLGIVAPQKGFG
ncbi:hypothetical protein D3C71_1750290 [compost metagenome]